MTEIIISKNFNEAREKIRTLLKNKSSKIIFTSEDDELNRKLIEKEPLDILLLNQKNRKDFSKQRNSGLNQVMVKIAKKNNIQIGINLDEIIESEKIIKSKIIARIKQNILLCNKNKVQMQFIISNPKNKRNLREIKHLGSVLSMPSWMTKNIIVN